jgi:integrase
MPRLVNRNPKYRKHRASGQAVVTLNGSDVYLGPHGTKASRDEYDRVIGEWHAGGRRSAGSGDAGADLYVAEVLAAYWAYAEGYYAGEGTGERGCIKSALALLKKRYGRTRAVDFGPLAMKSLRGAMVKLGWSRPYVNAQVKRIRRVFKWAVGEEMIPPSVLEALRAVEALKLGKTDAPEPEPVKPVGEGHVRATLDRGGLGRQVRAMVELQLVTGMRPGEVVVMRTGDVDTTGPVWTYAPASHKTAHHGHARLIYIGPKGQEILRRWLRPDLGAYLFQPAEAEAERRAELSKKRETPLSCGNRPGTNRRRRPEVAPGERYDVGTYRRAIERACEVAFGMPAELRKAAKKPAATAKPAERDAWATAEGVRKERAQAWRREHCWHPHQLRHTAATMLRKRYGLEAAQVILGHKTLTVTQIYAAKNVEAARRVMGEVG